MNAEEKLKVLQVMKKMGDKLLMTKNCLSLLHKNEVGMIPHSLEMSESVFFFEIGTGYSIFCRACQAHLPFFRESSDWKEFE